ncbi:MAG: hypothetical protein ABIQ02_04320 [Saprospiraceae bacterium]
MAVSICMTLYIGCSKDDPITPVNMDPLVTLVGSPIGSTTSSSIDASGGTLTSADGIVQLIVPAGAVSSATLFSIEPVSNYCPGGAGNTYRLQPEGITFTIPVSISFHYADSLVANENYLGIAYQDQDHTWFAPKIISLDIGGNNISVQAKHFSDWTIFERLSIQPKKASVYINESVSLKVTLVGELSTITDAQGIELNNLNEDESISTSWQASSGTVVKQGDDKASYTAPSSVPSQNPADVSVTFNNISFVHNGITYTNPKLFAKINVYADEAYFYAEFTSSLSFHVVGNRAFTETDHMTLKILQQGDSVTVYDIQNYSAAVIPESLSDGGCTTTLISAGDGWFNTPHGVTLRGYYGSFTHSIYVGVSSQEAPMGTQASYNKICSGGSSILIGGGMVSTAPAEFTFDASLPYQEQVQTYPGGGVFPDGFVKLVFTRVQ